MGEEDVVDTVRQIVFMMRIASPDVEIHDRLPDEPVLATFDRRLLSQAVQNIIKNAGEAIAAVPEEGRGAAEIDVSVVEEGGDVVIDVADSGKGFPAEGRHRLLEPYMTTREGGTGLGLAIVGKILEDHGGRIELLDNPKRRGGLVRLRFARTRQENAAPPGATQPRSERERVSA